MKKSLNKDILKKKKLYKLKVIFEKGVDLGQLFIYLFILSADIYLIILLNVYLWNFFYENYEKSKINYNFICFCILK